MYERVDYVENYSQYGWTKKGEAVTQNAILLLPFPRKATFARAEAAIGKEYLHPCTNWPW